MGQSSMTERLAGVRDRMKAWRRIWASNTVARRLSASALIVVAMACGATTIDGPAKPAQLTLGPGSHVSARASGVTKIISATGAVVSTKPLAAEPVGYSASSALNQRTAARLSASLARTTPRSGASASTVASVSPANAATPLSFLTDLSALTKDRRRNVGPTGRDSIFTSTNGHTQTVMRYGRPRTPDTLMTVEQDGRSVLAQYTQWTQVNGGFVIRSVEVDEYLPDGSRLQLVANLEDYAATPPASRGLTEPSAAFCDEESSCESSSGSGSSGGSGPPAWLCNALRSVVSSSASMMNTAYSVKLSSCDPSSPGYDLDTCTSATNNYDSAVSTWQNALDAYYGVGCTP
jgi:hypothetical protein